MADRIDDRPHLVRASEEHAVEAGRSASAAMTRRRRPRSEPAPHSRKFRAATIVLCGLAIAAIVVAVTILTRNTTTTTTRAAAPWSDWSPPESGTLGARDIADHVAPLYRLSPAGQLAVVTVVNLSTPTTSTAASDGTGTPSTGTLQVAVKPDPGSGAVSLLSGTTIAYNLCGIGGSNCAIGSGRSSTARLLLLRREALELALYTFRYIGGVENVVAILPPGRTQPTSSLTKRPPKATASTASKPVDIAVLFEHQELQPWLSAPLSSTLPEQFPPSVAQMPTAAEAGLVDQITARGLFSEQLVKAQDGSNLIVLNPLPPE